MGTPTARDAQPVEPGVEWVRVGGVGVARCGVVFATELAGPSTGFRFYRELPGALHGFAVGILPWISTRSAILFRNTDVRAPRLGSLARPSGYGFVHYETDEAAKQVPPGGPSPPVSTARFRIWGFGFGGFRSFFWKP